mmetsp:Transcript_29343/g.70667  ORF Transcript_29343/g.70667 Transcript_29343/m.70667 type:complete len:303 (-) Transcript_29343:109-1017(-)
MRDAQPIIQYVQRVRVLDRRQHPDQPSEGGGPGGQHPLEEGGGGLVDQVGDETDGAVLQRQVTKLSRRRDQVRDHAPNALLLRPHPRLLGHGDGAVPRHRLSHRLGAPPRVDPHVVRAVLEEALDRLQVAPPHRHLQRRPHAPRRLGVGPRLQQRLDGRGGAPVVDGEDEGRVALVVGSVWVCPLPQQVGDDAGLLAGDGALQQLLVQHPRRPHVHVGEAVQRVDARRRHPRGLLGGRVPPHGDGAVGMLALNHPPAARHLVPRLPRGEDELPLAESSHGAALERPPAVEDKMNCSLNLVNS